MFKNNIKINENDITYIVKTLNIQDIKECDKYTIKIINEIINENNCYFNIRSLLYNDHSPIKIGYENACIQNLYIKHNSGKNLNLSIRCNEIVYWRWNSNETLNIILPIFLMPFVYIELCTKNIPIKEFIFNYEIIYIKINIDIWELPLLIEKNNIVVKNGMIGYAKNNYNITKISENIQTKFRLINDVIILVVRGDDIISKYKIFPYHHPDYKKNKICIFTNPPIMRINIHTRDYQRSKEWFTENTNSCIFDINKYYEPYIDNDCIEKAVNNLQKKIINYKRIKREWNPLKLILNSEINGYPY